MHAQGEGNEGTAHQELGGQSATRAEVNAVEGVCKGAGALRPQAEGLLDLPCRQGGSCVHSHFEHNLAASYRSLLDGLADYGCLVQLLLALAPRVQGTGACHAEGTDSCFHRELHLRVLHEGLKVLHSSHWDVLKVAPPQSLHVQRDGLGCDAPHGGVKRHPHAQAVSSCIAQKTAIYRLRGSSACSRGAPAAVLPNWKTNAGDLQGPVYLSQLFFVAGIVGLKVICIACRSQNLPFLESLHMSQTVPSSTCATCKYSGTCSSAQSKAETLLSITNHSPESSKSLRGRASAAGRSLWEYPASRHAPSLGPSRASGGWSGPIQARQFPCTTIAPVRHS